MINNSRTSKTAIWMRSFIPSLIIPAIILIALYFISLQNYLLFHGIVELAGIAVALCIFIIVWNTRKLITNTFFLIVGISFLFTGSFDLIHTLAYKGMGVFAGAGSDLPTQLWIAARYFQSITFLIATLFIGKSITKNRKYDTEIIIITFTLACTILYASIFVWQNFPHCFIDGSGLTPFKIISEYIISAILVASIIVIYVRQKAFDHEVWQLLLAALIFLILGELAFTSYISVYGFMNMLGHLFRLISVYLFYRAFVVVSLTRPYNLLFRELKENENALRESEERYRAIYDQSPIAIELYDATGALVHVNPACLNLFGVKNMQVLGSFSLFADPNISDEQKTKLHQREMVQYQGPFDFEKVKALDLYPTSREGIIWLDVLITPLGNSAVPITGFLVQIQDITERNQAGVNLQVALVKYKTLFDVLPLGVTVSDSAGKILESNLTAGKLLGLPQDEHSRREIDGEEWRIVRPDGTPMPAEEYASVRALKGNSLVENQEMGIIIPGGEISWISVTAAPLPLEGHGVVITYIDITERKVAEEALRETNEYLNNLFDYANAPIITWDPGFHITRFNHAFERLTGRSQEEVLGKTLDFLFPDETRTASQALIQKAFSGERWETVEIPIITKEGNIRTVIWNSANVLDPDGRIISTIAQGVDITERKRAEKTLQESDEKIRTLLNSAAEAIYGLDMNGNCTFCNNSCLRLLGYEHPDELLGRNMHWQIHAKHPDGTHFPIEDCRIFKAFYKGEGTHVDDEVLWRSDGASFPAEYWSYPQRHEGKVVGAVVTFLDITERKQAEEALHQANKKLTMLNNITRHDILNQIMGLRLYLEISKANVKDPDFLMYIKKEEQAADAIQWMIEFTRDYQDIGGQAPKWQHLSDTISSAISQLKPPDVEINVAVNRLEVFADPLMEKVFYNLMENSLRHGEHVTCMDFSVTESENGLILTYADNGVGVTADDKKKLFLKGFGKHTGLGLFLSKEILSITGITITENGEPGKGARFEIAVPKGAYRFTGKTGQ